MCRCAAIRFSSCSARAFSSAAVGFARPSRPASCACAGVAGAASLPSNAGCSVPRARTHRENRGVGAGGRAGTRRGQDAPRSAASAPGCPSPRDTARPKASHLCAPRPGRAPAAEAQSGDDGHRPARGRRGSAPEALGLDEPEEDRRTQGAAVLHRTVHPLSCNSRVATPRCTVALQRRVQKTKNQKSGAFLRRERLRDQDYSAGLARLVSRGSTAMLSALSLESARSSRSTCKICRTSITQGAVARVWGTTAN